MNLRVNGQPQELVAGTGLVDLLAAAGHGQASRGVALAVNGEVVPRREWPTHPLADGDAVELLVAVQGG